MALADFEDLTDAEIRAQMETNFLAYKRHTGCYTDDA